MQAVHIVLAVVALLGSVAIAVVPCRFFIYNTPVYYHEDTLACFDKSNFLPKCYFLGLKTGGKWQLRVDESSLFAIELATNKTGWMYTLPEQKYEYFSTRMQYTSEGNLFISANGTLYHSFNTFGSDGMFCVDTDTGVVTLHNAGNGTLGSEIWDSRNGLNLTEQSKAWGFPSTNVTMGRGPIAPTTPRPTKSKSVTPTSSQTAAPESGGGSNVALIGGIAGGVLGLALIGGIGFYVSKNKKRDNGFNYQTNQVQNNNNRVQSIDPRINYSTHQPIAAPEPSLLSGNGQANRTSVAYTSTNSQANFKSYNGQYGNPPMSQIGEDSSITGGPTVSVTTTSSEFVVTSVPGFYRAIQDYPGREEDGELTLHAHARVYILTKPDEEGWCMGRIGGQQGKVNSKYLGLTG
ncbi:hypothetical protein BDR26DRAFT_917146 [Obelidium mucronatum]|nr:hypothetical protein BDR26DRAFT_917146 [Obelidium mucronatum]